MDNFNKGLASSTSIKPSSDVGGNKSDNENEVNPEIASKLKSPRNKQLPTKNFMNPTISATFKASVPKKKILGERNETVEQTSLQRSYSFGWKPVKSPVVDYDLEKDLVVGKQCLQPYDPVKNYLSPRPKFLRYDPDRRRKILNLQENDEDRVKISTYFQAGNDVPVPVLVPVPNSSGLKDSCSEQESVEDVNDEEDEEESGDDDEEMVEFVEERCCSVKGFFKFVFVVIAVILTTQAICSMNSPYPLQSLDPVWGFNHSVNHVCGLKLSDVGYGLIREPVVLVERLKEGDGYGAQEDVSETAEKFVEVQFAKTDEILVEDEVKASEVVETDYVEAETVNDSNQDGVKEDDSAASEKNHQLTSDGMLLKDEIKASEVVDTVYLEAETVDNFSQNDSDAYEKNDQLTNDVEFETANDMEDGVEKELDDAKTNDVLINITSFNLTIAILIGHVLVLTSVGAIYRSRCKKVGKEELKNLEPSTSPQSVKVEEHIVTNEASLLVPPQQNDVTKDISHVHIPSVELLGEFVFGEETISNMSPEIQTTAVSSSLIETSHTVKKQRRKNAEVVTPSSVSVRRSSRLKTRSSVMSP